MEFFQWLHDTWIGTGIRESLYLFPVLYTLHIFGVVILVGATSALDLRMMGWAMRKESVAEMAEMLLPWAKIGFLAQLVTGGFLFVAESADVVDNVAFLAKMTLVLLAGLNVVIFHMTAYKNVRVWEHGDTPGTAKFSALLSLFCWFGIVTASRLIALY